MNIVKIQSGDAELFNHRIGLVETIDECNNVRKQILNLTIDKTQQDNISHNDVAQNIVCHTMEHVKKQLAFIECFWGTDIDRIYATTECIRKNLKAFQKDNSQLKEWIFVEAQKCKTDACFSWVQKYGIKYIFKKIGKDSEDLWLKMPLWNIGVRNTDLDYLCFSDSDVQFVNDTWPDSVSDAFDTFDVLSLAGHITDIDRNSMIDSFGYKIMLYEDRTDLPIDFKNGHPGLTLGMTRAAYDMYGKFDAVNYLDDQWFWHKLIGKSKRLDELFMLPYKLDCNNACRGFPVKVGSTDETCMHVSHSSNDNLLRYQTAHDMSYCHVNMNDDIAYDKNSDDLPCWTSSPYGRIMRHCFKDFYVGAVQNNYKKYLFEEYGCVDNDHSLVIVSTFFMDFMHKTSDCILQQKNQLDMHCKTKFSYVCISDHDIAGIDCIKQKLDYSMLMTKHNIEKMLFNKKIVYPKKSIILYLDQDDMIDKDFYVQQDITKKFLTIADIFFEG